LARRSNVSIWPVKVRGILLIRNNRIFSVDFLNRTCTFDLISTNVAQRTPKIFFDSIGPERTSDSINLPRT